MCFFFFKQKTAYEMRISDWSSDVCSSDLVGIGRCDEFDGLAVDRHSLASGGNRDREGDGAGGIVIGVVACERIPLDQLAADERNDRKLVGFLALIQQAEHLARLDRALRGLPVGLASPQLDRCESADRAIASEDAITHDFNSLNLARSE